MTHQERFIKSLTFGKPDRYMLWQLFGLLPGVLERWISEGMPEPKDPNNPLAFFEFDPQPAGIAVNTFAYPGFEPQLIEDNDEYTITKDSIGRTMKLIKASASIPLPMDWPVCLPGDWEQLKGQFRYHSHRFASDWLEQYTYARRLGLPVVFTMLGYYHFPRQLMGDEQLAYAYYDYPEMLLDMQETYTELVCSVAEELLRKVEIDALYIGEDMAYRGGSMVSPEIFSRFMEPYYKRVIDIFKRSGVKIVAVDSDGYVGGILPLLLSAGVNAMYPFEVQANNNIAAYRQEYGSRLAIIGGLDKFCVTHGREAIDRELEAKLPEMVRTGGFIASLDHRVTIETPFEDYLYYVNKAKQYLSHTP